MRKLFRMILLLCFGLFTITSAQNNGGNFGSSIEGRIVDETGSTPLEFSNIILFNSNDSSMVIGTTSDKNGFFKLEPVRRGDYYVKVSFIGFADQFVNNIKITQRTNLNLGDIKIKSQSYGVDEVLVAGERAPISYEIDKKIINVSEQYTSVSGTAVDVLENVPSVTVDIEGNVSLRGSGNFQVLIDGRPTLVDGNDALQQTPASAIENIEIMTNPSAKYNPEGTAGIINIVMKKNKLQGISGIFDLDGGLKDKYGAGLSLDYKTQDLQIAFGADYNNRLFEMNQIEENRRSLAELTSFLNSKGLSNWGRTSLGLRTSASYNLSAEGLLTLGVRYGDREFKQNSSLYYSEWTSLDPNMNNYNSQTRRGRGGDSYDLFSSYNHKFGSGHELTAEVDYDYNNGDEYTYNEMTSGGIMVDGQKSSEKGPENELSTKLDYFITLPGDSKFEAGYQGDLEISEENSSVYFFDKNLNNLVYDEKYHINTKYDKNIYAFYSIYSGNIDQLGYQVGLRTEYTYRNIELLKTGRAFKIDRWDYFPTIHFSYKILDKHQLMASYTKRIQRPRGWELEPFETWLDTYNIRVGNPGLLPEYIDSYELGYQTFFGKSVFSVETYYRITRNRIERIRSTYDENTTLQSVVNVGKDYSLGTEMFINFDPLELWNVNLMGNLYDYKIEGSLNDQSFSRSSFNWSLRFNNSLKLSGSTQLQFNAIYNSPSVSSQGKREGFMFTNLALKQEFFNRMLTATLQIRDVFGSAKREETYNAPDFYSYTYGTREAPIVMLNLRFNINNYKVDRREGGRDEGMDMGGGEF